MAMRDFWPVRTLAAALMASSMSTVAMAEQNLTPVLNAGADKALKFDWPMLQIGTGEYTEGPTGVTVFRFGRKVLGAVDVRGGAPGTVNTDYLRLGYEKPELDAVVLSGGSFYGLESTTAVASALKDDNVRSGFWANLALAVGAIVYDFGDRRLNEIYPDKKLAQAALRAAQPGVFPLGARGAGRFVRSGGFFGCAAYSGQGGSFRQVGDVKVAAFVVVNSVGAITKRDGQMAACYPDTTWPSSMKVADLFSGVPNSRRLAWNGAPVGGDNRNTTISLVVTNQKMTPAELQRFAVHVHTSMARAIQPFGTVSDGDVLYAVSTGEVGADTKPGGMAQTDIATNFNTGDLGAIAAETMWDAILASVPEQPPVVKPTEYKPQAADLKAMAGKYTFSQFVTLEVTADGDQLLAKAVGERPAHAIGKDAPVKLLPVGPGQFTVTSRYPLVLKFEGPDRLIVNPGHWQQIGKKG
jgi:L-aminopeptidase/D-esterase-like protein